MTTRDNHLHDFSTKVQNNESHNALPRLVLEFPKLPFFIVPGPISFDAAMLKPLVPLASNMLLPVKGVKLTMFFPFHAGPTSEPLTPGPLMEIFSV